jgi:dihydroneopterin aldolase/2-amino-4-hydroxy-6-hydroxymethyldihydropteridine diphosphokinase
MGETAGQSLAFIAVGSNIEPQKNIAAALVALAKETNFVSSSTFYRTEPIGRPEQPPFINGVWQVGTTMQPEQIKSDLLCPIEAMLGRQRTADKFAPRTIDLDLVLYDDLVRNDADLKLPHPDIVRPFVHGPIRELLERDSSDLDAGLKSRIVILLPGDIPNTQLGQALPEFTQRLLALLGQSARYRAT